MSTTESKIFAGLLAISLGLAFLIKEFVFIHDTFGLFVAIFFSLLGVVFLFKDHSYKEKLLGYLIVMFFGLSLFSLEFYLLQWNTINIIFLFALSIGLSYLIYGTIINYRIKDVFVGFVFIAIALLIFLPKVFLIEDIFWLNVKRFLLPLLLIIGGITILLPVKRR
ncbi:MAG: hypothetical protein K6343_00735 [Caldisericaceae bacterium]